MSDSVRAAEAATALRATLKVKLAEIGFVVREGFSTNNFFVNAGETDLGYITVKDDRRDYAPVVSVIVKPSWSASMKTVVYWAGAKTDFVVPLSKVTDRVKTIATEVHRKAKLDAEMVAERNARIAREKTASAGLTELIKVGPSEHIAWNGPCPYRKHLNKWRVKENTFELELNGLSEEKVRAILDIVGAEEPAS